MVVRYLPHPVINLSSHFFWRVFFFHRGWFPVVEWSLREGWYLTSDTVHKALFSESSFHRKRELATTKKMMETDEQEDC